MIRGQVLLLLLVLPQPQIQAVVIGAVAKVETKEKAKEKARAVIVAPRLPMTRMANKNLASSGHQVSANAKIAATAMFLPTRAKRHLVPIALQRARTENVPRHDSLRRCAGTSLRDLARMAINACSPTTMLLAASQPRKLLRRLLLRPLQQKLCLDKRLHAPGMCAPSAMCRRTRRLNMSRHVVIHFTLVAQAVCCRFRNRVTIIAAKSLVL